MSDNIVAEQPRFQLKVIPPKTNEELEIKLKRVKRNRSSLLSHERRRERIKREEEELALPEEHDEDAEEESFDDTMIDQTPADHSASASLAGPSDQAGPSTSANVSAPTTQAHQGNVPAALPPSVEAAYKRKCIQLRHRQQEVEAANDVDRLRKVRLLRHVRKQRLVRAILLDKLRELTEGTIETGAAGGAGAEEPMDGVVNGDGNGNGDAAGMNGNGVAAGPSGGFGRVDSEAGTEEGSDL